MRLVFWFVRYREPTGMFLAGTYVNDNDLLALARGLRVRGRMECAERFEQASIATCGSSIFLPRSARTCSTLSAAGAPRRLDRCRPRSRASDALPRALR